MILSYFIWNASSEIFHVSNFALRWYGLLFALGFLISQQILYYMYKKEGKPQKDVDTLTIYMVVATVLGARLGHIIFYQPEIFLDNPWGVLLPFEFEPKFRFTGLKGLASHGGAFGILFALWIYTNWSIRFSKTDAGLPEQAGKTGTIEKKKKFGLFINKKSIPGQSYLQVLDRIVILVALTGCLIRVGNFFNSEIVGKPTNSSVGVVFGGAIREEIMENKVGIPAESMEVRRDTSLPDGSNGRMPINLYFFFKQGTTETQAREFLIGDVKFYLHRLSEYVDEPASVPLHYELRQEKDGTYGARVSTFGIARLPTQLYESGSCLLLFLFLFWLWKNQKENTPPGRIFGWFLVILWSLRFAFEFLKKNQVDFEDKLTINMGQILSIPLVIAGVLVLAYSYSKAATQKQDNADAAKIT